MADASGNANTGTAQGGVTLGATGPATLTSNAISLNGSTGYVQTTKSYADPEGFSEVAWFKTSSVTGGTVMGLTNVQGNGVPAQSDRLVWMDNTGKLVWAIYSGGDYEITSPSAYNNGAWHMAVAEIGSSGMQLWVDGTQVATNAAVTTAQSYTGYWHLGWGYESGGWPNPPTNSYLSGSLAHVAIVPTQLTASQISTLYNAGSAAAFAMDMGQLSPTSYWPLQDSASNICGTSEITVQQTVGVTNTCIYPAAAGTCAAPSSTYLATGLGVRTITAPATSTSVAIKITMELSAVSPAGVLGLHELPNIGFGTTKSLRCGRLRSLTRPRRCSCDSGALMTAIAVQRGGAEDTLLGTPGLRTRASESDGHLRRVDGILSLAALAVVVLAVTAVLGWDLFGGGCS